MSSDTARVLVRADAGPRIGSGHLVRCLTLAGHLRDRGARVVVATRRPPRALADRITGEGHELLVVDHEVTDDVARRRPWPDTTLDRDATEVLSGLSEDVDAVVVDHYGLDARWESRIRERAARVVVVDDLADRDRDADVVVDQNWYGPETASRYDGRVSSGCLRLLGPRYALLQPEYATARRSRRPVAHPPRRVLVSYGGADVTGETSRAVEALAAPDLAHLEVDVVVGSPSRVTDAMESQVRARAATTLHVALPSLAPLLARSDLALGASGAATWERLCLRVPGLVTTTGHHQSGVTQALAQAGLTTWAGVGGELTVEDHRELVRRALRTPPPVPPDLVDGEGARRVADAVLPPARVTLTLESATEADLPVHLGPDPGVGASGGHVLVGPTVWDAAAASFARDLDDVDAGRAVVRQDDVAVASVRARRLDHQVELTWSLLDVAAAQGLGPAVRTLLEAGRWTAGPSGLGPATGIRHPAGPRPPRGSSRLDAQGTTRVVLQERP